MSPTQRSLKKLRDDGYWAVIVERWNPYAKIRQDFGGFADLIALRGNDTLAVQTTSGTNVSARIHKIRETPAARIWLSSDSRRLEIHGWAKLGPRGKVKRWDCRVVDVQLADLGPMLTHGKYPELDDQPPFPTDPELPPHLPTVAQSLPLLD